MLLAMSAGNSHIALGVWDGGAWRKRWRIQTVHARTTDEYLVTIRALFADAGVDPRRTTVAILASVAPPDGNAGGRPERAFGAYPPPAQPCAAHGVARHDGKPSGGRG